MNKVWRGHRIAHCVLLCGGMMCMPLTAYGADSEPLSPEYILKQIEEHGPRSVIERPENDWGNLVNGIQDGIEAGNQKWAEVARRLGPATDAGSAIELLIAVSRALPKSPRLVLSISGERPLLLEEVCGQIPFDAEEALKVQQSYILAAEDALLGLKIRDDLVLEEKRRDCLHDVQAAKCYVFDCAKVGRSGRAGH